MAAGGGAESGFFQAGGLAAQAGRTGRVTRVRRLFGFSGLTGAAALLMASFYIREFMISAVIYFLGAICRLFIDPVTPLEEEPRE
ncbi:MAG: hypothetical protein A3G75_14905 [Verrucomicrobia bacterium RIFCSPLOWO2_12_FULL_64_8]|nr:MAG: hypothetical protein A3G75_14905 [Verrucomicrobia bacterium RIFCSPLOWO2_12_FULL_64_8]